jgi:hypothetical protein
MSAELKKILGEGGSKLSGFGQDNLYDVLKSIIEDITALKAEVTALDAGAAAGGGVGISIATLGTTIES